MAYLHWSRDMDTGIADIDTQHRHIVDYINQLASNQDTGNLNAVSQVLDELIDYTLQHFSFEEELQTRANYAFYASHKREHEKFTRRIQEFRQRATKGENVGPEVLTMLKKWLVHHIKGEDADYVAAIRKSQSLADISPEQTTGGWLSKRLRKFFV